jgi:hypothetical protein
MEISYEKIKLQKNKISRTNCFIVLVIFDVASVKRQYNFCLSHL